VAETEDAGDLSDLITEETFELVAPPIGVAIGLLSLKDTLDTLEEMVDALNMQDERWSPGLRERVTEDITGGLAEVRRLLDKVERRLS
jgi:hypothetical protein